MLARVIALSLICLIMMVVLFFGNERVLMFESTVGIILMLVTLIIVRLPVAIKCILVMVVIYAHRLNLYLLMLMYELVSNARAGTLISGKDDTKARNIVTGYFSKVFSFSHNFERLPSYPTIIITSYVYDRLEHVAFIMIPKNLDIIMARWFCDTYRIGTAVKHMIRRPDKGKSYDTIKDCIKKSVEAGRSPFAYVTKLSAERGYIGRVRSGIFSIAKELGIPITPVAIDYVHHNNGLIVPQNFRIKVGETFKVDSVRNAIAKSRLFFQKTIRWFIKTKFINKDFI